MLKAVFFPEKCTFWIFQVCDDYRACSRLFFSAKIALFGFSKSAATTGRAQGCFFSAKIALFGFSKPGAPIGAHVGPIAYCLDGVLGPYWGPYLPVFLMRRYGYQAQLISVVQKSR